MHASFILAFILLDLYYLKKSKIKIQNQELTYQVMVLRTMDGHLFKVAEINCKMHPRQRPLHSTYNTTPKARQLDPFAPATQEECTNKVFNCFCLSFKATSQVVCARLYLL